MQKIINVRASQGSLSKKLSEYTNAGWRIVSTAKGSEFTRVLNTYKWTVVLERSDTPKQTDSQLYSNEISTSGTDYCDQLIEAKQLLDSGALTQEEYDMLKKMIFDK